MPCSFEFDAENQLLRARLEGRITSEAVLQHYQAAGQWILQTKPRASIWDMSAVTSLELSSDAVARLARTTPADPDPARLRILVAPAGHVFGVARMFQTLGQGARPLMQVVHTLDEAYALLGISRPRFEPLEGAATPRVEADPGKA